MSSESEQLLEKVKTEFANKNFGESIRLCNQLISEYPESLDAVACRLLRANSYEYGLTAEQSIDASKALEDYAILAREPGWPGAMGHAGLARVLYFQDPESNAEEIRTHADSAIESIGHVPSMVAAGLVSRDHLFDEASARRYFLRAARERDLWGLKFYLHSLVKRFGRISNILTLPVLLLSAPFFKARELPIHD